MHPIISYLLESRLPSKIVRSVFEAASAIFEATNINKAYLIQQAGGEEQFKKAKANVAAQWTSHTMDEFIRNQNQAQKVINFLILMEIRQEGFVTAERMNSVHDLAVQNNLEQRFLSKVSSDTTPTDADALLSQAVESSAQSQKIYPDLTEEEEKIWNRVKVYHEFPDGFKWIYAVDDNGHSIGYMPSSITHKTMRHCGNQPSNQEGNQYWELRGPDGKAYLTIILNGDDCIEESKSYGNQTNKYRQMIKPYVKWFLRDQKVKGVGPRYDYGYATNMNFGVKDFMDDDQDFVNEVMENKPELLGNNERRVLMWKDLLNSGAISREQLIDLFNVNPQWRKMPDSLKQSLLANRFCPFSDDHEYDTAFGSNRYEVLCSVLGNSPFTEDDIVSMASHDSIKVEEFANHDVKKLTPRIQMAFAASSSSNHNITTMISIAIQVGAFELCPELVHRLAYSRDSNSKALFYTYMAYANPSEKCNKYVDLLHEEDASILRGASFDYSITNGNSSLSSILMLIQSRFPGALPNTHRMIAMQVNSMLGDRANERGGSTNWSEHREITEFVNTMARCSQEVIDEYSQYVPDDIGTRMLMYSEEYHIPMSVAKLGSRNAKWAVPDEYIVNTLSKLNDRVASYSRQTQSMMTKLLYCMMTKLLYYIAGLPDKDKAYRYAMVPSPHMYNVIVYRRNQSGPAETTYRALLTMLSSTRTLYNREMMDYSATPDNGTKGAIADMITHGTVCESLISRNFINADQITEFIDWAKDNHKWTAFVYGCRYAPGYNVPMDDYDGLLAELFMTGALDSTSIGYVGYLIRGNCVHIPSDKWNGLVEHHGIKWVVDNLFTEYPISFLNEDDHAIEIMKLILANGGDAAGPLWNAVFQRRDRASTGFTPKMKDKLMGIISQNVDAISRETVTSLANSKVLRADEVRKLIKIDTSISEDTFDAKKMRDVLENIEKVEAPKRVPFIIAAIKRILAHAEETDGNIDTDTQMCLYRAINNIRINAGTVKYDPAVQFVTDNRDAIIGIAPESWAGYIDYLATVNDIIKHPDEYLSSHGTPEEFELMCELISALYSRPNWDDYIGAIYTYANNVRLHGDDPDETWETVYSWGNSIPSIFLRAANDSIRPSAKKTERLREIMPEIVDYISNSYYARRRRLSKLARALGL